MLRVLRYISTVLHFLAGSGRCPCGPPFDRSGGFGAAPDETPGPEGRRGPAGKAARQRARRAALRPGRPSGRTALDRGGTEPRSARPSTFGLTNPVGAPGAGDEPGTGEKKGSEDEARPPESSPGA